MAMVEKHPATKLSLAEQAYRLLEEQIVTLRLHPGELLVEKELVTLTGIGRTPVREAMRGFARLVGPTLEWISAGGGLPIPYREGNAPLDLDALTAPLSPSTIRHRRAHTGRGD